ncbi:hybrid sensor histidine kinase/response regulator transcription factor [Chryseolinea sp. H1M3-3]|uniref:hybrid sensor histidine kinase/response regulator transcription factor n=1 Tax=Chryseolinea sp. H1M3-3 TaxID=3034144 RepID=UPI0023ECFE48|nr:hybrid sensor histidine kinase/response regulator transcription factor [Chryseolinea sp. H1M3-3]
MKLLSAFVFCVIFINTTWAQVSTINPATDLEALSGIQVNDIKQDSLGFLWIGTNEGLYRYDGYNLKLYEANPKMVGSSIITKIYFTRHGDLFVGTRGGLLSYNKAKDLFVNFKNDPADRESINGNIVNSIVEDNQGNLWIALSKHGIDLFDIPSKTFQHFLKSDGTGLLSDDISDLLIDKNNLLWISTWNEGLNALNLNAANISPKKINFKRYAVGDNLPKKLVIPFMFTDPVDGDFFIATVTRGVFQYDQGSDSFTPLGIKEVEHCTIYDAVFAADGNTWIATDFGVRLLNLKKRSIAKCPESICEFSGQVFSVFVDRQNITWLGTYKGIGKHVEKKISHRRLRKIKDPNADNVMAFERQGQYLWIGTWRDGLYLLDEKNNRALKINADNKLLNHIWDLKLINDQWLFVATGKGVVRLRVNPLNFKNTYEETNYPSRSAFTSFSKNTSGLTWVSTWQGGLYNIDADNGELKKYEKYSTKEHFVQALHVDAEKDQLWIGTVHSGLIRLTGISGDSVQSKIYAQETTPQLGLSSDFVSVIFEDNEKKLWIGTGDGGLNILDLETGKINWIVKGEQNLPSNTIRAIIQDEKGNIWISSKSGISKFDQQKIFINYTEDDGLEHMEFNPNAVLLSHGTLYFGSGQGYDVFKPGDLSFQKDPPRIFITDVKIFDKSISPGESYDGSVILKKPVNELETIELSYKVKNISFDFSALNLRNPKREIFAYMLEGFNDDWIYANASNRFLSFSNLPPGDYTLKIRTARNTAVGGDQGRILKIHIIPPIWQTTWFIVLAVVACVGLLYLWHWMRVAGLRRQKLLFEKLAQERVAVIESKTKLLEQQNSEIQKQAAQLHEADQTKINFFANISHEFRTPLMLIIGPIGRLMESKVANENESLLMIHRNSKRLLRLVDQIMDFSKLEAGNLTLETVEGDFIAFIKEIISSFNYLANIKNISVEFYSPEPQYYFNFDHDKVEKILYNLLSNAFKVTPPEGRISVTIDIFQDSEQGVSNMLQIEIFNTGKGIPKAELPNLFTRFYRTKSYSDGTGIGLSLTKSLVELHGGKIEVRSEENEGTWFMVMLPVQTNSLEVKKENLQTGSLQLPVPTANFGIKDDTVGKSPSITTLNQNHARTILILDDDEDMRLFISKLLSPEYNVLSSSNGEEALKLAYRVQPDVIISDMMMPVMDGYQFLREVKQNPHISHIPVILLTARASMDARLKGLEEGADDYITKPFHEKILLLRVKNLIERMQSTKKRFSTDIHLEPKEMTITSLDEKFMKNLLNVVEQNISNTSFNSDFICQELGVGRSYLYAKVKALTDLPVNEFVKTIRLKHAAVLLTKGQLQVNEVAYSVGFNDRYYFSKCFQKLFGVSPSHYQNEHSGLDQSMPRS